MTKAIKLFIIIGLLVLPLQAIWSQNSAMIAAFKESYTLEGQAEYKKAIGSLKNVYDAKSYETNLRLGWLYHSAGLFTEAIIYYRKAIDLRPMAVEARLGYVLPEAALANWDKVLGEYQKVLEIDPQNSLVNYRAGLIHYGKKNYKTAEKHFGKVVNLYPFDYSGLLMLGWTKYFLGKTTEAKIPFTKALFYSPDDKSAKEGLSLIKAGTVNNAITAAFKESYTLEGQREYKKAIGSLKNVYDSKSYEINLRLGWLYYNAGLYSEARIYYRKAIDLRPAAVEARLGNVLPEAALNDWDKVLEQYKKILEIDPQNSLVNYRSGLIHYGRKEYKTAEKYFGKVVNLYPFDYSGLLMLGWTKYFLGKTTEAKSLFMKVLLYSPDDKSAKEGLGLIK